MWNLSSLAQKAKEAAARLESQLDDSIGIADDSLFGKNAAAGDAGGLTTHQEHEDDEFDDDFFKDHHHDVGVKSDEVNGEQVKKLDLSAEEGDDFFGEDDAEKQAEEENEEEVDFGGNDGWEEGDEIALDDDGLFGDDQQQQVESTDEVAESQADEETDAAAIDSQQPDYERVSAEDEASTIVSMPPIAVENSELEPTIEPDSFQETESAGKPSELPADKDQHEGNLVAETVPNETEQLSSEQQVLDTRMVSEPDEADSESVPDKTVNEPIIQNEAPDHTSTPPLMDEAEKLQYLQTISNLEAQLLHREEQLTSKSNQITTLTLQNEAEQTKLRQIISETKEEAKRRILKSKERVEEMQTKLTEAIKRADTAGGSNHEQSEIIAALRAEGEQLARKQSQMEQSVRSAKMEARELAEQLKIQTEAKEKALDKISGLEADIKSLKEELTVARKGESQSKKLEGDLVAVREESEKQRATNLGLEQQLKELREENKSLKKEAEDARAGAAIESERESNKLKKERDDMLGDLESKLRTSEREANVREDALRHEVSELRKRWQDAVRRAEDLSMDVQHSTAPLLRQLESTERQNRARASAWAELETKLRSDLEEHVIQMEKLTKERNDLRASDKRFQRILKEKEDEIASSQQTIEALTATIENLEEKVEMLQEEQRKLKEEKDKFEKQASDGVAKVRSELMKTMVESEESYRSQIEALEAEVADERHRKDNLMKQLDALADNMNAGEFSQTSGVSTGELSSSEHEKKLRATTNQASILHDTLLGMDSDDDQDDEEDEVVNMQGGSFAAMEQLSQGLRGAKLELEALRNQLASSEETRENLVAELAETRQAAEKLPLFESKVSELTMEVNLKDMEIKGLQDDIADVRHLYRTQLDALLEEKAAEPPLMSPLEEDEETVIKIDSE